ARRQRNLRNSRTRDFRSSASGMEISAGMQKSNSIQRNGKRRRWSADANAMAARANGNRILLARGSYGLQLRARRFKAKNCFAFFHQIEAIASDCFQVADVCLKQGNLASLRSQQTLLLVYLLLQIVDLRPALHQFFVRRHKEAHNYEPDRDDEQ